ncbi:hypothetical protein ZIOFF_058138 [Zingiber officinale]|uniref:C2H2-type domain-containing protein n=1 Tax=Zingiber officinale TaxID=94328 RepID=A0A8J5KHI1_ZINOF|nr:hypothetical protein ZIOFF_058138 [Zingiber officinale]
MARAFKCKTCNRQFPLFQSLGGHRARHKKLAAPGGRRRWQRRILPSGRRSLQAEGVRVRGLRPRVRHRAGLVVRSHEAARGGGRRLRRRNQTWWNCMVAEKKASRKRKMTLDLEMAVGRALEKGIIWWQRVKCCASSIHGDVDLLSFITLPLLAPLLPFFPSSPQFLQPRSVKKTTLASCDF